MRLISDIMSKEVVTVTKNTGIRELSEIFQTRHFGTVPVVDDNGNLLGIVTSSDLIEQGRSLHIPTVISIFDWVIPIEGERTLEKELQRMTAQTVGEIYTEKVFTVTPSDPVSAAADLMGEHKLHALPVVENNKVVGIVARIDVIRTLND